MGKSGDATGQSGKRKGRWLFWLVVLAAVCSFFVVATVIIIFSGPSVPDQAILVVSLDDTMPAKPRDALSTLLLGSQGPSVFELYKVLSAAAEDDRVLGVCLELRGGGLGYADACDIKAMLSRLKSRGKKVVAYAHDLSFQAWALATGCDQVLLNPCGYVRLGGVQVQVMLLKGLLEGILGVRADFQRVGLFKTMPETLNQDALSEQSRLALKRLVDGTWEQLLKDMAGGRGLSTADMEAIIQEGPISAREARKKKLVDALVWQDELKDRLKREIHGDAEWIDFETYAEAMSASVRESKIAYLPITGMITPDSSGNGMLWEAANADAIIRHLTEAREDPTVKAVVLRVDSPGGDAISSARLYHAVRVTRKVKPVVVSMGACAASGGYYLAAGADYIVAHPYTLTGSIGIFGGKVVATELARKWGVQWERFSRGAFTGMFDPLRKFESHELEALKKQLTAMYKQFVADVAVGRREREDIIEKAAQGRVWLGKDALAMNLVNELGGLDAAIEKARALVHLKDDAALVLWPPPQSWLQSILNPRQSCLVQGESGLPLHGIMNGSMHGPGYGPMQASMFSSIYASLQKTFFSGRPLALQPFTLFWR